MDLPLSGNHNAACSAAEAEYIAAWSACQEAVWLSEILQEVWGYTPERHVDTRVVDVHISRLRAKLEDDPSNPELILTARGTGYLFQRIVEPGEE